MNEKDLPTREDAIQATKVILEVRAGIIPGEPVDAYTRRWALTVEDAHNEAIYLKTMGYAVLYAQSLMDPGRVNWVVHEWVWT